VYELENSKPNKQTNSAEEILPAATALTALADWLTRQGFDRLVTKTQVLIAPGYRFRVISGLVTNFHQPQSTLLLLVSAIVGEAWKDLYQYALEHDFRFLSYGDGSLLWVRPEAKLNP
jgi:S-adenosylmethionine:tRNA ribosyltransferase-isomerase